MKAIKFREHNGIYAKGQTAVYNELPACKAKYGTVVTGWKLNLFERIKVLFKGRIYIATKTFNKPLQPLLPVTGKWEILDKKHFKGLKKELQE